MKKKKLWSAIGVNLLAWVLSLILLAPLLLILINSFKTKQAASDMTLMDYMTKLKEADKLDFEISNTKTEEVKFHVQASEGLFNSTATTGCDDIYYINPTNGYIE